MSNLYALTFEQEQDLINRYKKAKQDYELLATEVGEHFMLLAKAHLKDGRILSAESVLSRCPDVVAGAFIADAIRQWTLEHYTCPDCGQVYVRSELPPVEVDGVELSPVCASKRESGEGILPQYVLQYFQDGDNEGLLWVCNAEDYEHAVEQLEDAEKGITRIELIGIAYLDD